MRSQALNRVSVLVAKRALMKRLGLLCRLFDCFSLSQIMKHVQHLKAIFRSHGSSYSVSPGPRRFLYILDSRTRSIILSCHDDNYRDDPQMTASLFDNGPISPNDASCFHCMHQTSRVAASASALLSARRILVPYGSITFAITDVSPTPINVGPAYSTQACLYPPLQKSSMERPALFHTRSDPRYVFWTNRDSDGDAYFGERKSVAAPRYAAYGNCWH